MRRALWRGKNLAHGAFRRLRFFEERQAIAMERPAPRETIVAGDQARLPPCCGRASNPNGSDPTVRQQLGFQVSLL
jgi:hypothetical protein